MIKEEARRREGKEGGKKGLAASGTVLAFGPWKVIPLLKGAKPPRAHSRYSCSATAPSSALSGFLALVLPGSIEWNLSLWCARTMHTIIPTFLRFIH